jgi:uncharacterized protein (TIGR00299 family) protein
MPSCLWIDPSHGAAGDMILGALLDAGADESAVRAAIATLAVEPISLESSAVRRHGLRATRVQIHTADAVDSRNLTDIVAILERASLNTLVRQFSIDVFTRIATAESHCHGIGINEVHFHEVGALDALADVVGVGAALDNLGLLAKDAVRVVGRVAIGEGGYVKSTHGRIPVPVPAVLQLLAMAGAETTGGGQNRELCTPTGAALLTACATRWGAMPTMRVRAAGSGAGSADPVGHPNITRVVLGFTDATGRSTDNRVDDLREIQTTVDDLDPRLWPGVLDSLIDCGALDAWLTPVVMRKGRPGHVLSVLVPVDLVDAALHVVLLNTGSLGARVQQIERHAMARDAVQIAVDGCAIAIKRGLLRGIVVTAQPEFADVSAAAATLGITERSLLARVSALAQQMVGERAPSGA